MLSCKQRINSLRVRGTTQFTKTFYFIVPVSSPVVLLPSVAVSRLPETTPLAAPFCWPSLRVSVSPSER